MIFNDLSHQTYFGVVKHYIINLGPFKGKYIDVKKPGYINWKAFSLSYKNRVLFKWVL